jgi:hypothetical protein
VLHQRLTYAGLQSSGPEVPLPVIGVLSSTERASSINISRIVS